MTLEEYHTFSHKSIRAEAVERMQAQHMLYQDAMEEAGKAFHGMLPQDLDTPDHRLLSVVEPYGCRVGFLWYLCEENQGVRQAFLCDFWIDTPYRRKGFGRKAIQAWEKAARADACRECVLFVAKENAPAQGLYVKCGFVRFQALENGYYVKKAVLAHPGLDEA